jgi:Thioredoxin
MGQRKKTPPRVAAKPEVARTRRTARWSRRRIRWPAGITGVLLAAAIPAALTMVDRTSSSAAVDRRIDREVGALLAGIPQNGSTLGSRTAPVTMEVFVDLEDPTSRWWFREDLPEIVEAYVRTGALKLSYHAFKRNTYWPAVFIKQQAAALAAGAQNKLWNFIYTFLYEQGSELTHYVSESFLRSIASQVPGMNLTRWQADRLTGRRQEQITAEDQAAKAFGLYVTPAFRIGKSSGPMSIFTGRRMVQYSEQHHPIALIEASDVVNAIELLAHDHSLPPTRRVSPEILTTRLE